MSDENPAALSMLRQRQIIIERQRGEIERLEAELAEMRRERDEYKAKWDGKEGVIAIERYDRRGHFMDRLHDDKDRLEAELAESRRTVIEVRRQQAKALIERDKLWAELADLRASSVVVRESVPGPIDSRDIQVGDLIIERTNGHWSEPFVVSPRFDWDLKSPEHVILLERTPDE